MPLFIHLLHECELCEWNRVVKPAKKDLSDPAERQTDRQKQTETAEMANVVERVINSHWELLDYLNMSFYVLWLCLITGKKGVKYGEGRGRMKKSESKFGRAGV